jgi:asparagine synthase (glutamine-hydrolysing)
MCGIAGVLRFDGQPVDPALVAAMADQLEHRGPDDRGQWLESSVGLGHTRLSIIDPHGSPQPMESADGRFHITFNGEIFNYRELRSRLDYPFRTNGDTEVVLALFTAYGVQALQHLRGQFAFAVYDRQTGGVTLARDRMGILPLVYSLDHASLTFGSEVKALLPAIGEPRLEETSLAHYLRRRAVPAPDTLYAGVRKLPPGHVLSVSASGQAELSAYWSPPPPAQVMRIDPREAVDLVDQRLQDAVRDAMVADVPVGSYLSGGVDSSLIVAMASRLTDTPMHTFCASFGDPRFDEVEHARRVSDLFGTNHHEISLDASGFQDLWPRLTAHRDAPVSEPADIAVFLLAQDARKHVKVALSGEGSDELFAGYPKYRFADLTIQAGRLPTAIRRPLLHLAERAAPTSATRARIAARALMEGSTAERAVGWFAPFTTTEVAAMLGRPVAPEPPAPPQRDGIDLLCRMDLAGWLPDNLLERGDRMSMAASLEVRPPFLDHRLVETAMRLPSDVKVRDGQTKWVVKEVADRYLPQSITRRRKVGFKVPLDAWFRTGMRDLSRDLLLSSDSITASWIEPSAVRALLDSHTSGRRNEEARLWTLLSLEQWARTCLRTQTPVPGSR